MTRRSREMAGHRMSSGRTSARIFSSDPVLARNRIMTPQLPVPDKASKIEEYVHGKSKTKEEYMKSISNAMGALIGCPGSQLQFHENGRRIVPEESDFPTQKFRDSVVRQFDAIYEKVGIPQPLTTKEEEQKLFDAYKTKDEYMSGFVEFLDTIRAQQIAALEAIQENNVEPEPAPKPNPFPLRPPVCLKPIPGCPPMPSSPPASPRAAPAMSELEARRSVFKRFANLFTVCVRKDGKDPENRKKK